MAKRTFHDHIAGRQRQFAQCGETPHILPLSFGDTELGSPHYHARRLANKTDDVAQISKMLLGWDGECATLESARTMPPWVRPAKTETAPVVDHGHDNVPEASGDYVELTSWLPSQRKTEILKDLAGLIPELRKHRKAHLSALRKLRGQCDTFSTKTVPAWVRLSPTASETGNRLIIGLRDNTCAYREEDPLRLGCLNCGYYAGTGAERRATIEELMLQVRAGFSRGFTYGSPFDVLEFLGDGSFLNDEELSDEAQERIFGFVAEIPYIKRVLVESRPEYLTNHNRKLAKTLERLRSDQELEIGVGLETADDFVRATCINKGFGLDDFEAAVKQLASVNQECSGRCALLAYLLVKPALLTPAEAVHDTVETLRCLARMSEAHGVRLIPKLEPAAVATGTVLSLLHSLPLNNRLHYFPLNYWAVLEIITRAFLDEECQHIFSDIRIGGREDMDDVLKLPAVYGQDGRYDQFDFVLYDAIQDFNQHHDLFRLYAILKDLYPDGIDGLLCSTSSLSHWRNEDLNGDECHIIRFLKMHREKIEESGDSRLAKPEEDFRKTTYRALNQIEGHSDNDATLDRLSEILRQAGPSATQATKQELGEVIFDCFRQQKRDLVDVDVLDVVREPDGFVRVFSEVIDFVSGKTFALWAGIPVNDEMLSGLPRISPDKRTEC